MQFLLLQFILEKLDLFKLSVKLEFQVIDDVSKVSSLVLEFLILDFKWHDSLLIAQAFVDGLLQFFLQLFKL